MIFTESAVHANRSIRKGWIGLDIGGANIKLAWLDSEPDENQSNSTERLVESFPFPLWKSSKELPSFLTHLLSRFPNTFAIAVTMTGELADCYSSREVGVCEIVEGVEFAIGRLNVIWGRRENDLHSFSPGSPLLQAFYYAIGDGSDRSREHQWLNAAQSKRNWSLVAAANWHAIATYVSRFLVFDDQKSDMNNKSLSQKGSGPLRRGSEKTTISTSPPKGQTPFGTGSKSGFLVDIGSTTTDIIPIESGAPCGIGNDDFSRLKSGELFYAGLGRTPVCSLAEELIVEGHTVSVAREFFATIEDALIVLGLVAENPHHCGTADGRPATKSNSRQRLARMLCNDSSELKTSKGSTSPGDFTGFIGCEADFDDRTLDSIAQQLLDRLQTKILKSIRQVVSNHPAVPRNFVASGQGAWLAEKLLAMAGYQVRSLSKIAGEPTAKSAAAVAVAQLAFEDLANKPPLSKDGNLLDPFRTRHEASSCKESCKESVMEASKAPPKDQSAIRVVKLGGSLIDSITTPERLRCWIENQEPMSTLWIAGGGKLVETVREFDHRFALEEKTAHWLCLDLMTFNLRLIQHWFPDWPIRNGAEANASSFALAGADLNQLVDFGGWIRHQQQWIAMISNQTHSAASKSSYDEPLAESWDVTSDSCAAYFAQSMGASELVLLKSCEIPSLELARLADMKITDPLFPKYASGIPSVRVIQLKSQT